MHDIDIIDDERHVMDQDGNGGDLHVLTGFRKAKP